jgi:hypothetical protein
MCYERESGYGANPAFYGCGVKCPVNEVDQTPPSVVEVKKE